MALALSLAFALLASFVAALRGDLLQLRLQALQMIGTIFKVGEAACHEASDGWLGVVL